MHFIHNNPSRSRVGLPVDFFKFINSIVCVHLGGSQVGMTQEFLDGIQVGTLIKHMSGKSVAEHVWTPLRKCGDHAQILINDPVYQPRIELFAFIGNK